MKRHVYLGQDRLPQGGDLRAKGEGESAFCGQRRRAFWLMKQQKQMFPHEKKTGSWTQASEAPSTVSHLGRNTHTWLELLLGMLLAQKGSSLLGLISGELSSSTHGLLVMQVTVSCGRRQEKAE